MVNKVSLRSKANFKNQPKTLNLKLETKINNLGSRQK
jgi:hypothetical protein